MYANVLQGAKGGLLANKHVLPRFPVSSAEVEYLIGNITIRNAYPNQESATPLVDLKGTLNLDANNTPLYRQYLKNIPEFGTECTGGYFAKTDAAGFPANASWLVAWYGSYNGGGGPPAVSHVFGPRNAADSKYIRLQFTDGTAAKYRFQVIEDTPASYAADFATTPVPADLVPRAMAVLYDAATGLFYYKVSGETTMTGSAAGYAGLANAGGPLISLGAWPALPSECKNRYAIYAYGAGLDNQGVNLAAIMRRFGWQ